ncbi:hypothetical protein HOLleu_24264 [Holothuria leucospilota]|uniref:Death domain-containing protein n=1 Tax=Holothuria leucospilota TaxID=206669 RepID=A0A9Q1H671_HOLLE|nr:hypothetical protein HOLleu_24264 [Holothuria leucospilota]
MERKRGDVSKEIVQDKDLFQDLSHKITAEWKNVARVLNIEEAHIYRIQKDNDDCIQEQIYQMLFFWRKKEGDDATYSVLSQALKRAGRKDLADESSSDQGLLPRECEQTRLRGISHEGQRNRDGEDNTDRPMTLSNEASSRKRVEDCNSQSDSAALTPSGRNDDESKPCQPFSDITRTKNQDFMPTVNIKSEHDSHSGEGINDRKTGLYFTTSGNCYQLFHLINWQ